MNIKTINEILRTSKPSDWLHHDEFGIYTYKHDVELCIKTRYDIEDKLSLALTTIQHMLSDIPSSQGDMLELASFHDARSNAKYEVDWIENFPDKSATRMHARVFYSGSFVTWFLFVLADGARIILPSPTLIPSTSGQESFKYVVDELEYNLGKIIQQSSDDRWYKEQFHKAGISLGRLKYDKRI